MTSAGTAIGRQLRIARWVPTAGHLWIPFVVATAIQAMTPIALALALGLLVERVGPAIDAGRGSPEAGSFLWALVLVLMVTFVDTAVRPVTEALRSSVARRIDGEVRARTAAAAQCLDFVQLESQEVQDIVGSAKGTFFGTPGAAAAGLVGLVGRYVQAVAALAIIARASVLLAVLLFVVLTTIRRRWQQRFLGLSEALLEGGSKMRLTSYYGDLAIGPHAAKEIRIFGLTDWLIARSQHFWDVAAELPLAVRARLRRSATVELAALTASYIVTFVVVARAAVDGSLPLADVAAIAQATFVSATLIVPTGDDFAIEHGRSGLDAPMRVAALVPSTRQSRRPLPARRACSHSIVFDGVTFAYPGAADPVIAGLDLEIPAGSSLALVGANGAGKTTFVKLLTGFYTPTAGAVLVDGIDLREIDEEEWQARCAAIFQDFVRFELSMRDNVGFGAVDRRDDSPALEQAMSDAGAADLVDTLPDRWDTVLSTQHAGGTDLSGGQWQRVALARAVLAVASGAGVLVLDEPTANLDVRSEKAIFDRCLSLAAHTTSLLITHRLSSVRRADRIALLADGRIAELGTHDELIAADGGYRQMFDLQARQFADSEPGRRLHAGGSVELPDG